MTPGDGFPSGLKRKGKIKIMKGNLISFKVHFVTTSKRVAPLAQARAEERRLRKSTGSI